MHRRACRNKLFQLRFPLEDSLSNEDPPTWSGAFRVSHLLLAVYQATKVRFLTLMALINGAAMVGELLWLSVEVVSDRCQPFFCKNPLLLSVLKSELLYTFFEAD